MFNCHTHTNFRAGFVLSYVWLFLFVVSSCPAGYLRHRAYCVLCFGVWKAQRKLTHKATKTAITN